MKSFVKFLKYLKFCTFKNVSYPYKHNYQKYQKAVQNYFNFLPTFAHHKANVKISIVFFLDFLFENSRGKIFNLLYCHDSAPSTIGKTEQTTIAELQSQSKFPKKNILSKNITFFSKMFLRGFLIFTY
jgi:hypothetical protein